MNTQIDAIDKKVEDQPRSYPAQGTDALYVRVSRGTVDQSVARLTAAAAANRFGIVGVIDMKAKLIANGVAFRPACRIIEVCNPHQAKIVLESDMAMSVMLPCRVCVYEHDGQVMIATLRPTATIGHLANPGFEIVVRDIEAALVNTINAACK